MADSAVLIQPSQSANQLRYVPEPVFPMEFSHAEAAMLPGINWISPSYNFDISGFDIDLTGAVDWAPSPAFIPQVSSFVPPAGDAIEQGPGGPAVAGAASAGVTGDDGLFYADDTGARRPRNGHYSSQPTPSALTDASANSPLGRQTYREEPEDFWFLHPAQTSDHRTIPASPQVLAPGDEELIYSSFIRLCLTIPDAEHAPFKSDAFPSIDLLNAYIRNYRQCFDPRVLPFIHTELGKPEHCNWQLMIAIAGTGSVYAGGDEQTATCLHEFLRRGLKLLTAPGPSVGLDAKLVGNLQSMILNYIFIAYYGSRRMSKFRLSSLNELRSAFLDTYSRFGSYLRSDDGSQAQAESNWYHWLINESLRRALYSIWLLDCMACYHFGDKPLLLLDYGDILLPCREATWLAPTASAWIATWAPSASLEESLRTLYVEKRLIKGTGHFARVLLIHGLYCQNWTIAKTLQPNLLRWTPSARKGNANAAELMGDVWLPAEPIFRDWRNSSCDCLDVLHWIANSDIAKSGTENTTVLNLHLSRIVLLAPFPTIRQLARQMMESGPRGIDTRAGEGVIKKWIFEDQYKARLAMIHCGVFLWHVRRYSTQSFYEPDDVFMVILTVWAYAKWGPPRVTPRAARGAHDSDEQNNDQAPSDTEGAVASIRLDRPTDDELVQLYIKQGRSMIATIAGVGDITSPRAPAKTLREGCRVLGTLSRWGRAQVLHADLLRLLENSAGTSN